MSSNLTRNPNLDLNEGKSKGNESSDASGGEAWRKNISEIPLSFPRDENWWTGPIPAASDARQGVVNGNLHALPIPNLTTCTRREVQAYFDNGWMLTELLFACLVSEEAFYRPPYHNLRHPLIFYYTHPAVLYINKLHVAGLIEKTLHPYHERLFETGVDEMSWDDLSKNEMEWPEMSHCFQYRKQTYAIVSHLIATHPGLEDGHAPVSIDSPLWALFMGFEHERIHLETSSVLIRELPVNLVRRHPGFAPLHPSARPLDSNADWKNPEVGRDYPENTWHKKSKSTQIIGKAREFPSFGWDNEYGRRQTAVREFSATRQLISNGEYYEFVREGGYREKKYWSDEGWRWRTFRNVKWPSFWVPVGPQGAHQFALRTCFEVLSMPWDWPVTANYHEAKAYAAWRSRAEKRTVPLRLMTEAEHHSIRHLHAPDATAEDIKEAFEVFATPTFNTGLRFGSETPVNSAPNEDFADVFGNVWQWLEDHFHFLEGFQVHSLYDDFSTPCFDGHHQMIMGGSFISAGDEASVHARFHFRPHFTQHAGFRLVDPLHADNKGAIQTIEPAEDDVKDEAKSRRMQLFTAFAAEDEVLIDRMIAPEKLSRNLLPKLIKIAAGRDLKRENRILEVGSGVGGLTYRLAALGAKVIGSDISKLAIDTARDWQKKGFVECINPDTGATIKIELDAEALSRIDWRQTDAGSLPAEYFDFDVVVLNRVLSQLPSPKSLLSRLSGERGLVRPGAHVLIADRFSWSPRSTPTSLWIKPEGNDLAEAMGKEFELVESGSSFHVERPAKDLATIGRLHFSLWRRRS